MSTLLISESPLQVLPSLAEKIGLNQAIILQQIHYWLQKTDNVRDDQRWVYNSYPEWQKQFPWWGLNTIKRAIYALEEQGLLISANYNQHKMDKTKWYRIDYDKLETLESVGCTSDQDGMAIDPKWADVKPNLGRAIPETTQETSQETNNNEVTAPAPDMKTWSEEEIVVTHGFQAQALRVSQKLGTSKEQLKSLLKVCRDHPGLVDAALSFAIDYPSARDRTKLFFYRVDRMVAEARTV